MRTILYVLLFSLLSLIFACSQQSTAVKTDELSATVESHLEASISPEPTIISPMRTEVTPNTLALPRTESTHTSEPLLPIATIGTTRVPKPTSGSTIALTQVPIPTQTITQELLPSAKELPSLTIPTEFEDIRDNLPRSELQVEYPILFSDIETYDLGGEQVRRSVIYKTDTSFRTVIPLTEVDSSNFSPSWSPTGKQIAFESIRDGQSEIYLMESDGSNQRRLTFSEVSSEIPRWLPNGQGIVFSRYDSNAKVAQLYTIDASGGEAIPVTDPEMIRTLGSYTLSPDAQRIAYEALNEVTSYFPDTRLYIADFPNGTGVRVTELLYATVGNPVWSHDYRHIAYRSNHFQGGSEDGFELFVYDFIEDQHERLVSVEEVGLFPSFSWSPDSKKLIVAASKGVFLVDLKTKVLTQLNDRRISGIEWYWIDIED